MKKDKFYIEKELLESLLLGNCYTGLEIANIFNISNSVISFYKKKYYIQTETAKRLIICEWCKRGFYTYITNRRCKHIFCSRKCNSYFKKTQFKYEIEPELLLSLYWGNEYSTKKIADLFGTFSNTIVYRMRDYKIPTRNRSDAGKLLDNKHCIDGEPWQKGKTWEELPNIPHGEKSGGWKGGVSTENEKQRKCVKSKKWRESVFERDGYCCQLCHDYSRKGHRLILHPHHIKAFADYPDDRFDINNGITLCKDCHLYIHRIDILSQQ